MRALLGGAGKANGAHAVDEPLPYDVITLAPQTEAAGDAAALVRGVEGLLEHNEAAAREAGAAVDARHEELAQARTALERAERAGDVVLVGSSTATVQIAIRAHATAVEASETATRGVHTARDALERARADVKREKLRVAADASRFHERVEWHGRRLVDHLDGVVESVDAIDREFAAANKAAREYVAAGGDPSLRELDSAHVFLDAAVSLVEMGSAVDENLWRELRYATSPRHSNEPAIRPRLSAFVDLLMKLLTSKTATEAALEQTRRRIAATRMTRTVYEAEEVLAPRSPAPTHTPYRATPPNTRQRPERRGRPGFTEDEVADLADVVREVAERTR
jgi:hypothetical protein